MKTCPTCDETKSPEDYGQSFYCKTCMAVRTRAWRAANPEAKRASDARRDPAKKAARNKAWVAKNRERRRAYRKAKYAANREREVEGMRVWRAANTERRAAYQLARDRANPAQNRRQRSARRAAEKRATPRWVDHAEIQRRYDWAQLLAEEFGRPFHVDHVVPLTSPIVCGLHWHGNLAVIPAPDNQAKSNRRWPNMPVGA